MATKNKTCPTCGQVMNKTGKTIGRTIKRDVWHCPAEDRYFFTLRGRMQELDAYQVMLIRR
jgi:hypothetical protein